MFSRRGRQLSARKWVRYPPTTPTAIASRGHSQRSVTTTFSGIRALPPRLGEPTSSRVVKVPVCRKSASRTVTSFRSPAGTVALAARSTSTTPESWTLLSPR